MNVLQQIFYDHFHTLLSSNLEIRETVIENVEKMLHCGDYTYGFAIYYCEHCNNTKTIPFTCKSRFCTSCGNLYSKRRSTAMSFKLINTTHRHCVFTIPEQLRPFFRKDRDLLNCLFHAVRDVILRMFYKLNKSENFTPGFVCVLHTFGRNLQWNPHIHVLLSHGGSGNHNVWRTVKHFNFTFLRNAFRTVLLNLMHAHIGNSFKKLKAYIYKHCSNGFYVYAKYKKCSTKSAIKYIGRYLGRPVIASSRIDNYDGTSVTFHYNKHEDNSLVVETISALDFIKRLIVHIPDKHFKMIRYYGLYAKHHKNSHKLLLAIPKQNRHPLKLLNSWRASILMSFGYDPLRCRCGRQMTILEFCHKGSPLFEIFRKYINSS